ncbi:MAG: MBL fold metallo-hydrolase [Planctomycetes bacterium]|nr:MBL fold metallo-hydrolase [Planctomycetota bacterium]
MSANVTEIARDVYRVSVYVPQFDLEFNHFVVKDDEPLLYHTGMRSLFPELREAVAKIVDPARIRWIGFSHFEVDECGALNDWLAIAPKAQPTCGVIGAVVNLGDFAIRPPRGLEKGETFSTGHYRFRYQPTPHLPHGWDAGVLFEETQRTLFCSDLFHHTGRREPITESDVASRSREAMVAMQASPLMDYLPFTPKTVRLLNELADLQPKTLAIMHGSSFVGDGAKALRDLAPAIVDTFGKDDGR